MYSMGLGRVELPTSRLSGVRSNHLSYRPRRCERLKVVGMMMSVNVLRVVVVGLARCASTRDGNAERAVAREPRRVWIYEQSSVCAVDGATTRCFPPDTDVRGYSRSVKEVI